MSAAETQQKFNSKIHSTALGATEVTPFCNID